MHNKRARCIWALVRRAWSITVLGSPTKRDAASITGHPGFKMVCGALAVGVGRRALTIGRVNG